MKKITINDPKKIKAVHDIFKFLKYFVYLLTMLLFTIIFLGERIFGSEHFLNGLFVDYEEFYDMIADMVPLIFTTLISIVAILVIKKFLLSVNKKILMINEKNITIKRLFDNIIQFVSGILILFAILKMFGVNATAIVASAGVLTLVIGLGMQSLIQDVVSGIFVILEKSFEVNDVVVLDNFKGTVKQIGLRTTKLVDVAGNTLVVCNSDIRKVVNNSGDLSVAICRVGIEYEASIPEIEEIISKNLAKYTKNIPLFVTEAEYKGVSGLLDSSVELMFIVKCKEPDLQASIRALNRAIKMMFDENGINIPFNQIVINNK